VYLYIGFSRCYYDLYKIFMEVKFKYHTFGLGYFPKS
jgi:hypothetical protein